MRKTTYYDMEDVLKRAEFLRKEIGYAQEDYDQSYTFERGNESEIDKWFNARTIENKSSDLRRLNKIKARLRKLKDKYPECFI